MEMETTVTQPEQPKKKGGSFWDIIKFTFIALIIVIPLRVFIAQPFVVSGASMVPTFENGDYLIIDEVSYYFNEPKRGDVIVFRYPQQPDRFFIKRTIGLPGETITIKDDTVTITNTSHPEGFVLEEQYIDARTTGSVTMELGEGEYFVMGDNREASSDSRSWGVLPEKFIVGRALVRLLPLRELAFMPGAIDLSETKQQ